MREMRALHLSPHVQFLKERILTKVPSDEMLSSVNDWAHRSPPTLKISSVSFSQGAKFDSVSQRMSLVEGDAHVLFFIAIPVLDLF